MPGQVGKDSESMSEYGSSQWLPSIGARNCVNTSAIYFSKININRHKSHNPPSFSTASCSRVHSVFLFFGISTFGLSNFSHSFKNMYPFVSLDSRRGDRCDRTCDIFRQLLPMRKKYLQRTNLVRYLH
jgi:hypothetical protein